MQGFGNSWLEVPEIAKTGSNAANRTLLAKSARTLAGPARNPQATGRTIRPETVPQAEIPLVEAERASRFRSAPREQRSSNRRRHSAPPRGYAAAAVSAQSSLDDLDDVLHQMGPSRLDQPPLQLALLVVGMGSGVVFDNLDTAGLNPYQPRLGAVCNINDQPPVSQPARDLTGRGTPQRRQSSAEALRLSGRQQPGRVRPAGEDVELDQNARRHLHANQAMPRTRSSCSGRSSRRSRCSYRGRCCSARSPCLGTGRSGARSRRCTSPASRPACPPTTSMVPRPPAGRSAS